MSAWGAANIMYNYLTGSSDFQPAGEPSKILQMYVFAVFYVMYHPTMDM